MLSGKLSKLARKAVESLSEQTRSPGMEPVSPEERAAFLAAIERARREHIEVVLAKLKESDHG